MSTTERRRTLAELVDTEAPVPAARATSIMVAVARELAAAEAAGWERGEVVPAQVALAGDGSVEIGGPRGSRLAPADPEDADAPRPGTAAGASIGRMLFELLTGRPPLGRDDAFEPVVLSALSPRVSGLLARSFSDAPGQWPDAVTWRDALEAEAGPMAPPLPPTVANRLRRRRLLLIAGLVLLAVATLVVLVLAPSWWDSATVGAAALVAQPARTSS